MPILCSTSGVNLFFIAFIFSKNHWILMGVILLGYAFSSHKDSSTVNHTKSNATFLKFCKQRKWPNIRYFNISQVTTANQLENHT